MIGTSRLALGDRVRVGREVGGALVTGTADAVSGPLGVSGIKLEHLGIDEGVVCFQQEAEQQEVGKSATRAGEVGRLERR